MTKTLWVDLVVRAFNTFWQAFSAAFFLPDNLADANALEAVFIGAVGAGLSALNSALRSYRQKVEPL